MSDLELIKPLKSGKALLDEISADAPEPGHLSIWWLGQSGYVIKSRTGMIVIDPYLSEHLTNKYASTDKPHIRMTEAPFRGHELGGVDAVLTSHKHSDLLDPGTAPAMMANNPQARLIVPKALISHATGLFVGSNKEVRTADPRCVLGIDAGESLEIAGFRIKAIASAHEGLDTDDSGHHLYLGFVVEVEGLRLYHSGDTLAYDGLADALSANPFDVLFLPINGRDPKRGVAGNMSSDEAVELARDCAHALLTADDAGSAATVEAHLARWLGAREAFLKA